MAKAKAWLICLPSGVWEMPTLDLVLLNINGDCVCERIQVDG